MYIPNSGKSEQSKRHVPRPVHVPKISIIHAQKDQIYSSKRQWQLAAATRAKTIVNVRTARHCLIRSQFRALKCAHAHDRCGAPSNDSSRRHCARNYYDSNLNSTGGTDELVTSPNQDNTDSGASENSLTSSERTSQLLLGIATVIIARFVMAT